MPPNRHGCEVVYKMLNVKINVWILNQTNNL